MKVGLHPVQEPGHCILRRWRDLWALALHDGQQLRHHLRLLVPAEEVGHQARGENIIDVLEKALLLDAGGVFIGKPPPPRVGAGCTVFIEKTHPILTLGHGRAYELHILENITPSPPL